MRRSATPVRRLLSLLVTALAVVAAGSSAMPITAQAAAAPRLAMVGQLPVIITSPDHRTVTAGEAFSFMVTTVLAPGYGPASIDASGALPHGVTLHDNGDGTGALSGTPSQTGVFSFTLQVAVPQVFVAMQSFTLTVNGPPSFTSPASVTARAGVAMSFPVTTAGMPPGALDIVGGDLPAGVTLQDHGDGSATLGGTPTAAGVFAFGIRALNTVFDSVVQRFTLTVTERRSVTSPHEASFVVGVPSEFDVTTSGWPQGAIGVLDPLPAGLSLLDHGDGTATISGTSAAGTAGTHEARLVLPWLGESIEVPLTIRVARAPVITSPSVATFTAGVWDSFTVTTTDGVPTSTNLSVTGALVGDIIFWNHSDGTGTFSGTAGTADIGDHVLTVEAFNDGSSTTQDLVLRVVAAPPAVPLPTVQPQSGGLLTGVPGTAKPGDQVELAGTGYQPGAPITIGIYSAPLLLGTATANAAGTFTATVTLPASLGQHTVVSSGVGATGQSLFLTGAVLIQQPLAAAPVAPAAPIGLTVATPALATPVAAAPTAALAATGTDNAGSTLVASAVLLLGGMVLLVGSRRRRLDG